MGNIQLCHPPPSINRICESDSAKCCVAYILYFAKKNSCEHVRGRLDIFFSTQSDLLQSKEVDKRRRKQFGAEDNLVMQHFRCEILLRLLYIRKIQVKLAIGFHCIPLKSVEQLEWWKHITQTHTHIFIIYRQTNRQID